MGLRICGLAPVLLAILLVGCGGGGSYGGGSSSGGNSNNPVPTVSSISPTTGIIGGAAFTLSVTGTNFVSGSVVKWNGVALTTTYVSTTSLTASVPANDLAATGAADVTVTNPAPGGGTSGAQAFNVNNPAPVIVSLSSDNANAGAAGFTLTLTGSGFIATSQAKWNGAALTTSFVSGTQLTAAIPSTDLAFAGSAQVTISNAAPGGGDSAASNFTINSAIAHGVGLPGAASVLAINATTDLHESNPGSTVVVNQVVMNRLDVRFGRDATVGQVNDAIGSVGGGIVSMAAGFPALTIAIPAQAREADLQALADHLGAAPSVHNVKIATITGVDAIFPHGNFTLADAIQQISPTLPGRFPAAWNLAPTSTFGDPAGAGGARTCPVTQIPLLVDDAFYLPSISDFSQAVPPYNEPDTSALDVSAIGGHGYIDAQLATEIGFGTNAFARTSGCTRLELVQLFAGGDTQYEQTATLVAHMPPSGRFIVTFSINDGNNCSSNICVPPQDVLRGPAVRAYDTLNWKERTRSRWNDFLVVTSAGNTRGSHSGAIYPGLTDSRFNSRINIAASGDNLFEFMTDASLWTPSPLFTAQGFASFTASGPNQFFTAEDVRNAGLDGPDATENNVIVVGSVESQDRSTLSTQHVKADTLAESWFSNTGPDVLTVGEHVFGNVDITGTSFAAPQVAGLVSYLWMLSDDLQRVQPVTVTKRAIVANTRNRVIDAYATVLSLDETSTPSPQHTPMRFRLLNVNNDAKFDELDIEEFLRNYFLVDAQGAVTRTPVTAVIDFSRYDLNGDGFTGGSTTERFDLDRSGSTQYGASVYSNVIQYIGGDVSFNETEVTDLQILCYYAFSTLFTGDEDVRDEQLANRCAPITVTVQPAQVSLQPGATQQFGATVTGTPDQNVTWTVSGAGNAVNASGLVTAGLTPGSFKVRATSEADPAVFGEASLVVAGVDCAAAFGGPNSHALQLTLSAPPLSKTSGSANPPFTDTLDSTVSHTEGTLTYGSLRASTIDNDTGAVLNGFVIFETSADALLQEDIVIVPRDSSLIGMPMQVTATAEVGGAVQVTGDRAQGRSEGVIAMPFAVARNTFIASTIPGNTSGNVGPLTISATSSDVAFGLPFHFSAHAIAAAKYPCVAGGAEACPPATPAGTGAADVTATLQSIRFSAADQNGAAVPVTVCSSSGTVYQ